ncbi:MAG: glyoxalase [Chloroflexi bacterium]|nr:glyoxalase [Chloroflexota bacterium]
MAKIESISHSGINVVDLKEAEEFYASIFGGLIAHRINFNTDDAQSGRAVHSDIALNDWLFAMCLPRGELPMPPDEQLRGTNGFRHGFHITREAFGQLIGRLQRQEVPFEGPRAHPDNSPLGESVYFKDPGGNFLEVCWRRDVVRGGVALDAG